MPTFDYNAAVQAGYSDDEIADYLQQQRQAGVDIYIPKNQYESAPAKKKTFLREVGEGIVRPFARAGATVAKTGESIANIGAYGIARATGDKEGAQKILNRNPAAKTASGKTINKASVNLPYVGETKLIENPAQAFGPGAEIGASLTGGGAVRNIIKEGGKGLIKRAIVQGAKESAFTGGAYGFGGAVQKEGATAGSVLKETAAGAIVGGAIGGVVGGTVASRVPAGQALRRKAEEQTYKAIGATTKKGRAEARKVIGEIIDRNIIASEEGLKKRAEAGVAKAGQAIDDLGPLQGKTHITEVLGPLKDELNKLKPAGSKTILPSQRYQSDVVDKIAADFQAYADDEGFISNEALRAIRRIYDKEVSKAGGFLGEAVKSLKEGSVLRYKREAANSIRGLLVKSEPDLAKLNKEYSFWAGLNKLLENKATKATGRGESLGQIAVRTGLSGGTTAQKGLLEGGLVEVGLRIVQKASNSTFWRLLSVNAKKRISNALLSGSSAKIQQTVSKELTRVGGDDAQKLVQEISEGAATKVSSAPGPIAIKKASSIIPRPKIKTPVSPINLSAKLEVLPREGFDELSEKAKNFIVALDQSTAKARASGDIGGAVLPHDFSSVPKIPEDIAKEVGDYLMKHAFRNLR